MLKEFADVVVVGGGLGGCMAALSVAKMGLTVILTEETDWIGGQLTSQAVPPDEHKWIEKFGCTATYREFRNRVRQYYTRNYPLSEKSYRTEYLNPGNAWVSRLSHEPKVALQVLEDMMAPYVNSGKIRIHYLYIPIKAERKGDFVESVIIKHKHKAEERILFGKYFVDATECGDLLPLAGIEYVTGAESKEEYGEPHAPQKADPRDMQSITHVMAVEYVEGGNDIIERPEQYDFWRKYTPVFLKIPLLSFFSTDQNDPFTMREFSLFPDATNNPALFTYRRIIDRENFADNLYKGDITLINWPQNDYFLGSIIDVSKEERDRHLYGAKQLSLSLLYWLQTEAPRPEGGFGYPGLRLRNDVLGTNDGLAKYPYIRESRRIKAEYIIKEDDISMEIRGEKGIKTYTDSIGVGSYYLDLHHTTISNRSFYLPAYPYEIPLGAVLPRNVTNLLPACKNIGTTQIANGSYRVHPTEWNIGESVGYLAAFAILKKVTPRTIWKEHDYLKSYQKLLVKKGVQLHWHDSLGMELSEC